MARSSGFSIGMAVGLPSLVITLGIVGFLWKGQIDALGKTTRSGGVDRPLAALDATKLTGTIVQLKEVGSTIENWRVEHGGYPGDIATARERPGEASDSWGADMVYAPVRPQGKDSDGVALFEGYTLTSRGQDGLLGTDDDLVYENGFIRGGMPANMIGKPGGQVAHGDASSEEARTTTGDNGFVDPGPSGGESLPAGRRALDQARSLGGQPAPSGGGGDQ